MSKENDKNIRDFLEIMNNHLSKIPTGTHVKIEVANQKVVEILDFKFARMSDSVQILKVENKQIEIKLKK